MQHNEHITKIDRPGVISNLLTKHFKGRGKLRLHTPDDHFFANLAIVENDADARCLLVDSAPPSIREHIESASHLQVRCVIDSLYTWFEIPALEVFEEGRDRYYEIVYPKVLFQLQRRESFRVDVPKTIAATLTVRNIDEPTSPPVTDIIPDGEAEIPLIYNRIMDVSTTGVGIHADPLLLDRIHTGSQLYLVRIHIQELLDIIVDVYVRNMRTKQDETLVGLEFTNIKPLDTQALSRCVMDLQRQALLEQRMKLGK